MRKVRAVAFLQIYLVSKTKKLGLHDFFILNTSIHADNDTVECASSCLILTLCTKHTSAGLVVDRDFPIQSGLIAN